MQGTQLGYRSSTENRGMVEHLLGIEKIGISCFDYQGMVIIGSQFG